LQHFSFFCRFTCKYLALSHLILNVFTNWACVVQGSCLFVNNDCLSQVHKIEIFKLGFLSNNFLLLLYYNYSGNLILFHKIIIHFLFHFARFRESRVRNFTDILGNTIKISRNKQVILNAIFVSRHFVFTLIHLTMGHPVKS
jgi:hypothetical protein